MSILDAPIADLWRRPAEWATKLLADRPKVSSGITPTTGAVFGQQIGTASATAAMTSSGWLFAAVDKIANSMGGIEWGLYRQQPNGDKVAVPNHPLVDIWKRPNPFYTRAEFLTISFNHFEIAGEMIWACARGQDGTGPPVELWPLRPDRITVIPSDTDYIKGYTYKIGPEVIPFGPEDIIFIRRPSPRSEYRGMGVIESIIMEVDGDRRAAEYSRNFYANSAEPGGVIELEQTLSDNDWKKMVDRWRQQHQGVSNAHRVAILERGKWVDRKYSRRDMQFIDARKFTRDIIYGAFGIPLSVMGIAENVNLANALVGQATFADGVVKPRAVYVTEALNKDLVPLLDRTGTMAFEFKDPTPRNRQLDTQEANIGYTSGVLTLNEARAKIGEGAFLEGGDERQERTFNLNDRREIRIMALQGYQASIMTLNESRALVGEPSRPDGDELRPLSPGGGTFEEGFTGGRRRAAGLSEAPSLPYYLVPDQKALPGQADVNDAADEMFDAWEARLTDEVEALVAFLEDIEAKGAYSRLVVKFEPSDIEGYDWDWLAKHGDEVIDEMASVFFDAITVGFPEIIVSEAQRLAQEYAAQRGAQLLTLEGDLSIARVTRARVRKLTADALENGDSLGQLAKQLREDPAFGRSRAVNIARTETATALGQGEKQAALLQGRNEKHWVTQGDDVVESECLLNEAAKWIPINDLFPTGKDTIPQHPRCLPGFSLVSAQGVSATSERWYEGELVTLRTRSGNLLTCTPNHPILTRDGGWHRAGNLHKGLYVISSTRGQGMDGGNDDHQNVPAPIEEITRSFGHTPGVTPMEVPLAPEHFHGDGKGSKVAVIWSDGLLGDGSNALLPQHLAQLDLKRGYGQTSRLTGVGGQDLLLHADGHSARGGVGCSDLAVAVTERHTGPLDPLGGSLTSDAYPGIDESLGDGPSAYPIPSREQLYRVAGLVFADELVEVRREPFTGHVYNLQTDSGMYVAESIVTHNCRCVVRSRTVDEERKRLSFYGIDARCPSCNHLAGKGIVAGEIDCRRCGHKVVIVEAYGGSVVVA